jgi:glyoxylase-like metal-dependent hydrolase (beta-lactamase superfamily II)
MPAKAHIHQYADNLYLISLPVPIKGFDGFIGAWVYAGNPVVLVDVGPAVSASCLLGALAELGLGHPGLILLTHIHIDHAGAAGLVCETFPNAKVVCHPKAVAHLIDPQRLWEGSLKTLGEIAKAYESIAPVAEDRVVASDQFHHADIRCIESPGHAAHHVSFMIGDLLFAGEAAGVCLSVRGQGLYLRPATPPRFFLETNLESIDRLVAQAPQQICYGHVGRRNNAVEMLKAHRRQLLNWREMILPFHQSAGGRERAVMQACAEYLLANDPLLDRFGKLAPEVRARERNFLSNSIKGYWGYLERADQVDPKG